MSAQCEPTGACTAGVKVRITRQRTAGRFARPSDTGIAAGVTPVTRGKQRFCEQHPRRFVTHIKDGLL